MIMIMIIVIIIIIIIIITIIIIKIRGSGGYARRRRGRPGGSADPRPASLRDPLLQLWISFGDHPLKLERYREY